jgi:DNA-damage-inducible protein D
MVENQDSSALGSSTSPFEAIRQRNETGNDYWSARDLGRVLGYTDYRNFKLVLNKAKQACFNSGQPISDHFGDITEMVDIGSDAKREIDTVYLSRYACYLVIQNADPAKEIVAAGQTYFAVQTRRQELTDENKEKSRRLFLREELKAHNVRLAGTAKNAGVATGIDYAIFQNHGYMGLYGGLTAQDIHRRKGLKAGDQILDHMGSTELAANLFRATQTEEKLRREKIIGKEKANQAHEQVGRKVRQTIKELGGTLPEHLPAADSLKKIKASERKKLKELKEPTDY